MEATVRGRPAQLRPSTLRSICGDVVEKSCVVHRISPQTFVKYGHGLEEKEEESQPRAPPSCQVQDHPTGTKFSGDMILGRVLALLFFSTQTAPVPCVVLCCVVYTVAIKRQ